MGLGGLKYKVAGGEMTGDAGWGAVQLLLALMNHSHTLPPAVNSTPLDPVDNSNM
jgi:hypothetical protein